MKKRGVSTFTAETLLIAATIGLATILVMWSQGLFNDLMEEGSLTTTKTISCTFDIDLKIVDACYDSDSIDVTIDNNKDKSINGDLLLIRIEGNNVVTRPTPPNTNLEPFEREVIYTQYDPSFGVIKKISIIPRIEENGKAVFCSMNKIETTSIRPC